MSTDPLCPTCDGDGYVARQAATRDHMRRIRALIGANQPGTEEPGTLKKRGARSEP